MRRLQHLDRVETVRLLPSAGVLIVWIVLMGNSGGFEPTSWLPAGLVLGALLALSILVARRALPYGRAPRLALLSLAAFTAWCYLSIAWSEAPGTSWASSNLLLVGLLSTWTLALAPWRAATLQLFTLSLSAAGGVACLLSLLHSPDASNLATRFTDSRFAPPLYYPNSTAAFCFMAALPALVYAAKPGGRIVPRALFEGIGTFLCCYALLPQSRGAVLGGAAALAVLAITVPFRWRMVLHLAVVVVAMGIMVPHASHLYEVARTTGNVSPVLRHLASTLGLLAAGGALAGAALAFAGARLKLAGWQQTWVWRSGFIATGLAVLACGAVAVHYHHSISHTLKAQWHSLEHPGTTYGAKRADDETGRLNSIDPLERYDYLRVSMDGFRANPIGGMGAGAFVHRYTQERRYEKLATFPHNLVMKVLGDTGLVGAALMLAFLAGVLALLRRKRGMSVDEAAVRASSLAVFGYFLFHGEFDWLEAYPVLVGPALGLPLAALAARGREEALARVVDPDAAPAARAARRTAPRPWARPAAIGGGVVVAVAVAYSLAAPWLAVRYQDRAVTAARVDKQVAYDDLDRAASANPLDDEPLISRGVLALSSGDMGIAQDSFRRALDREQSWLPHFGLGLIDVAAHQAGGAQQQFAWVRRLNPLNATLPPLMAKAVQPGAEPPATLLRDALVTKLFDRQIVK